MSFLSQGCLRGSWDTVTVSRNPSRLLGESATDMQTKQWPGSLLHVGVCLCISVPVCVLVIMSYMKHEWWRWRVSLGTNTVHTYTLSNTLAYRNTLRIRMLIHSLSSIPANLTTAHAVLDSLSSSLSFRTKSVFVTLLNLVTDIDKS